MYYLQEEEKAWLSPCHTGTQFYVLRRAVDYLKPLNPEPGRIEKDVLHPSSLKPATIARLLVRLLAGFGSKVSGCRLRGLGLGISRFNKG